MKYIVNGLVTFVLLAFSFSVQGVNKELSSQDKASMFTYDKQKVEQSFEEVTKVEQYAQSKHLTLQEVKTKKGGLLESVNLKSSDPSILSALFPEPPLGIPSFLWGCFFGVVGILLVYLTTESSEETKKAVYGMLVGWIGGCLLYVLFWVLVFGNSAFWSATY